MENLKTGGLQHGFYRSIPRYGFSFSTGCNNRNRAFIVNTSKKSNRFFKQTLKLILGVIALTLFSITPILAQSTGQQEVCLYLDMPDGTKDTFCYMWPNPDFDPFAYCQGMPDKGFLYVGSSPSDVQMGFHIDATDIPFSICCAEEETGTRDCLRSFNTTSNGTCNLSGGCDNFWNGACYNCSPSPPIESYACSNIGNTSDTPDPDLDNGGTFYNIRTNIRRYTQLTNKAFLCQDPTQVLAEEDSVSCTASCDKTEQYLSEFGNGEIACGGDSFPTELSIPCNGTTHTFPEESGEPPIDQGDNIPGDRNDTPPSGPFFGLQGTGAEDTSEGEEGGDIPENPDNPNDPTGGGGEGGGNSGTGEGGEGDPNTDPTIFPSITTNGPTTIINNAGDTTIINSFQTIDEIQVDGDPESLMQIDSGTFDGAMITSNEIPEKGDLQNSIQGFIDDLLPDFSGSDITLSAGDCNFTSQLEMFGGQHNITMSFCDFENVLITLGDILFLFSTVWGVWIIMSPNTRT